MTGQSHYTLDSPLEPLSSYWTCYKVLRLRGPGDICDLCHNQLKTIHSDAGPTLPVQWSQWHLHLP
jgi:hypothetical protein